MAVDGSTLAIEVDEDEALDDGSTLTVEVNDDEDKGEFEEGTKDAVKVVVVVVVDDG